MTWFWRKVSSDSNKWWTCRLSDQAIAGPDCAALFPIEARSAGLTLMPRGFSGSQRISQLSSQVIGSRTASQNLQIEIVGNIDEEERGAITALLEQLNEVARNFFAGNDGQALAQALALDVDSSEIAGFSLDLLARELQVANAQYREVAATSSGQGNGSSTLGGLFEQLGALAIANNRTQLTETLVEQLLAISFSAEANEAVEAANAAAETELIETAVTEDDASERAEPESEEED